MAHSFYDNQEASLIDLTRLVQFGYAYHPDVINQFDLIDETSLHTFDLASPWGEMMLAIYQKRHKPILDALCQSYHRKDCDPDGMHGPATRWLLAQTRCGVSDYPHPREAMADVRFPDTCLMGLTVSRNFSRVYGLAEAETDGAWVQAFENFENAIVIAMQLRDRDFPNTHIFQHLARLYGATLADQMVGRGSCSDSLEGRFDYPRTMSYAGTCAVVSHELGHACGLRHSDQVEATMFASITQHSTGRHGAFIAPDLEMFSAVGYELAVEQPPPEKPLIEEITHTTAHVRMQDGKTQSIRFAPV